MSNPFVLDAKAYKRDLDILNHYVEDQAFNLHRQTGQSLETCKQFVKDQIGPGGQFEFRDPEIRFLRRKDNGDREVEIGTLMSYLNESIADRELIAPTLTTYCNPKKKESLLVKFIDGNVKARGVAKKAKFKAEMAGDMLLMNIKDNEQNNKKLSNNSVSGSHVTPTNPLYNKTGHSTLTSNCRTTSGYGNANNEKFFTGNRHYWSADIVKNNIVSIAANSKLDQIQAAMDKFGIRHPTVEETIACIKHSTDLYWGSAAEMEKIKKMVEYLTPVERSAFVYTGDLYHLMLLNDQVVRSFLATLSRKIDTPHPDPNSVIQLSEEGGRHFAKILAPETHVHLAVQIMDKEMKGVKLEDLYQNPSLHARLTATAINVGETVQYYADLIRAFWVTIHVPASVAYLPNSIRRSALISDTDSTIFTVQDWVMWFCGKMSFDQPGNAIAATMIFLAAETITHVLARMSANFGIGHERIFQIAMKNEFKFDVLVTTQVAKHYFALIGCQEGNLFKDYKKEIKGVHLRSSNAPPAVNEKANELMMSIMYSVLEGRQITMNQVLEELADVERKIIATIKSGGGEFFRRGQVKTPEAYTKKNPAETNYINYLLWDEVFAPKYGSIEPPPYTTLKVTVNLDTPVKVKEWLETMPDQELANRFRAWSAKYGKTKLGTIMLPEQVISSIGIPEEIMSRVGVREMVSEVTKTFSLILESLGYYYKTDKHIRLLSDTH